MKKIIFCVFLLMCQLVSAQRFNIVSSAPTKKPTTIDSLLFTVQYTATTREDVKKPDELTDETVRLRIGNNVSEYYSYTVFVGDSVLQVDFASGASQQTINEHAQQFGNGIISHRIYKNYPKGKLTTLDRVVSDDYKVEEPLPKINWTITSDTLTVCGYLCKKATARFLGRDYEAWFTPEIPRSDGPWKLQGLPGLILKASDSKNDYQFVATGIEQAKKAEAITFPNKEYRPISRQGLNALQKRLCEDPVGFIHATSPNVSVKVTDEMGNEVKKYSNPYNPIELE